MVREIEVPIGSFRDWLLRRTPFIKENTWVFSRDMQGIDYRKFNVPFLPPKKGKRRVVGS